MAIFNTPTNESLEKFLENSSGVEEEQEISEEGLQLISEMAMHILLEQDEIEEMLDSDEIQEMVEEGIVNEASVVRLDRNTRLKQLTQMAVFQLAREKDDPQFKKLLTIWRFERNLEEKLTNKYGSQAKRIAMKEIKDNYKQVGRRFVKVRGKGANNRKRTPRKGRNRALSRLVKQ